MKPSLLLSLLLAAASFVAAKPPADLQQKLDALVKGGPGGAAVAWVDADGLVFFQSGKMSAADPRAITPDTPFEIGSVSKVFTSLLLAESERQGKVSRLDPAAKYLLPAADPAQAALARITLLTLATHTSGLPRLPSNALSAGLNGADPYAAYGDDQLVAALRTDGPRASPSGEVAYSNFGAALLGESLAAAWGSSYADALTARVLAPLGLRATTLGLAGQPPPAGLAPGHVSGQVVPSWTFQAFAPAGALRSSAREMGHFLTVLITPSGNPLEAAIHATLQPQHRAELEGMHVGLAWYLFDDPQTPIAWHNGATAGSHAFVAFNRKTGAGVAILSNIQLDSEPLGFGLLGAAMPVPAGEQVKHAADYVGTYPLTPAVSLSLLDVQGTLRMKVGATPSQALRTVSPDHFTVVGVPAEISFERDPAGKVVALVLHQNGTDQRGLRGPLEKPPVEVTLPAEMLREYVGHYPLAPQMILTVTAQPAGLFVQMTGQPKFPAFASAKDEFFLKVAPARISFQRDAEGKVQSLILRQGGRELPAQKSAE